MGIRRRVDHLKGPLCPYEPARILNLTHLEVPGASGFPGGKPPAPPGGPPTTAIGFSMVLGSFRGEERGDSTPKLTQALNLEGGIFGDPSRTPPRAPLSRFRVIQVYN